MKQQIKQLSSLLIYPALILPTFVYGVDETPGTGPGSPPGTGGGAAPFIKNPISSETIAQLLTKLLELFVQIGIAVVTMGIIYAGFIYVTARGDKGKIAKAHTAFYWTIIGSAVVLGAFAIVKVVSDTITQVVG
jgi:hypothetical protein